MDWSLLLKVLILLGLLIAIAVYWVEYETAITKNKVQGYVHDPHAACSLCKRLKSDVSSLVAGVAGSLCSDCLINSALLLDDASRGKEEDVRFLHRLLIAILSKSCESEHCDENLKKYIIEVGSLNFEQRLPLLTIAYSYENTSLIINFLNHVPREQWKYQDVIFWMYANCEEGNYREALNNPDVKREECTDAEYRLFTLNRIVASIELMPKKQEIVKHLADLDSIRSAFDNSDYPYKQDELLLLPNVLGTMAKCHYLLGNYKDAFDFLNKESVLSVPSSYSELLRGNVHEKLGQIDEAKMCWQKGLQINDKGIVRDHLILKLERLNG